ncbi:MAG: hypothetical protein ACYDB7_13735, partial [Mycobacteriales bacterium]
FGHGCRGVSADRPDDGCCTHGAFYADRADEQRVRSAARELSREDWQWHGTTRISVTDTLGDEPARRTRTLDGACVFANRVDFSAGAGCALHALALRTGRHPLQTKPLVCWQVPLSRKVRDDSDGRRVSVIGEFNRDSWGEGGADLSWWCTDAAEAHTAQSPLFERYAVELEALLGEPAYQELTSLCRHRLAGRRPLLPLIG